MIRPRSGGRSPRAFFKEIMMSDLFFYFIILTFGMGYIIKKAAANPSTTGSIFRFLWK